MIIQNAYISLTTLLIILTSFCISVESATYSVVDTCHVSGTPYSVNENNDLILSNSATDYTFVKFSTLSSTESFYTSFQLEIKDDDSILSFFYGTNSSIVSEVVLPDALQIVFVMKNNAKLNQGIHLIDSWGSIVYTWPMPAVGLHSFEILVDFRGLATVTIDTQGVQSHLAEYESWAELNGSMYGILVHTDQSSITLQELLFQKTLSNGTVITDNHTTALTDCNIVKSQTLDPIKYIGIDTDTIVSDVNFNNIVQTSVSPNSFMFSKTPGDFNIALFYSQFLEKDFRFSFDINSISLLNTNFDFIVALGQSASESTVTGSTNANLVFRFTNDEYTVTGTGISESFTPIINFGYKIEIAIEIKTFSNSLYYINVYSNGKLIFCLRKEENNSIFTVSNSYFSISSPSSFSVILSDIHLELSDRMSKIPNYTNLELQELQYSSNASSYPRITDQGDIDISGLTTNIWGALVNNRRWQDLDSFTLSYILYDIKFNTGTGDNACFYFGAKRHILMDNIISGGFGICLQISTYSTKPGLIYISPNGKITVLRKYIAGRTQGADIKFIYRKSSTNTITVFVDAEEFNFDIPDFDNWLNIISGSYYGIFYRADDYSSLARFGSPRIYGYNSTHYEDYNFNSATVIPHVGNNEIYGNFTTYNNYYINDELVNFSVYLDAGTIDNISPQNGLSLLLHTWDLDSNKFRIASSFNLNYRKINFSYTFVYVTKNIVSYILYELIFGAPSVESSSSDALFAFTIYRTAIKFVNLETYVVFLFTEGETYDFNFEYVNNLDFTSSITLKVNGDVFFTYNTSILFDDTISYFGLKSDTWEQQSFFENIALSYEDKVVNGEGTVTSFITAPNPQSTTLTSTSTHILNYLETSIIEEYLTEVDISLATVTNLIETTTEIDKTTIESIQTTSTIEVSETEIEVLESLIALTITSESVFYSATSTNQDDVFTFEVWDTVSITTSTSITEVLPVATTTINLIDTLYIEETILTKIEQGTRTIEVSETEIEVLESLIALTITSESIFYPATSTNQDDIFTFEVWDTVSITTSTSITEVLSEATTTTNLINTLITVDDTITINPSYTNTVNVLNTEIIQVENEILLTVSSNIIYSTQTNIGNTYFQTNTYYESYSTTKTSIIETDISFTTINIETLNTVISKTIYETVLSTSSDIILITSIETETNIPDANPVSIGLISGLAAGGLLLVGVASASAYYIHNKGYVPEESKFVQGNGFVHDNPFYQPQREFHENELYTTAEI